MIQTTVKSRVAEWTEYGTEEPWDAGLRTYPEYLDHPKEAERGFAIDAGLLVVEGERLRSIIEEFEGAGQLSENLDSEVDDRIVTLVLSDTPPGGGVAQRQMFHAGLYDTARFSENDVSHEFVLRDPGTDEQVGVFDLNEAKLLEEPDVDWETEEWTFRIADHEQSE